MLSSQRAPNVPRSAGRATKMPCHHHIQRVSDRAISGCGGVLIDHGCIDAHVAHPTPAEVAERLQLPEDAEVVARVNHYFTDDEPVQIGTTYIPTAIAAGSVLATDARTGRGSIYERFAELGHDITSVREEITARMPRPDEVSTLAIPAGVPVIELLHTGIDQNGQPFEVTRFVMRADRSALDYRMNIEDQA